ncbi:MAG: hypothetical protein JXQ27_18775 [Acidobacteria bacterium]|nr:hypothetical protein [Acidobacteriota bacterium]
MDKNFGSSFGIEGQQGYEEEFFEAKSSGDDSSAPGRLVVFVCAANPADDAMNMESLAASREPAGASVRETGAEVLAAKAADQVLATGDSQEEPLVQAGEEFDTPVTSPLVAARGGSAVQVEPFGRRVVDDGQELEVPSVGVPSLSLEHGQGVDIFFRRASLKTAWPLRCSTSRWCLQKETSLIVVSTQYEPMLVVYLDGGGAVICLLNLSQGM